MYPDKIIYDYDLRIEILKRQGISAYKIDEDRFYVLYSIYENINIGDIIYTNSSKINKNSSDIRWGSGDTIQKKTICNIEIKKNEFVVDNNCFFSRIVDFGGFNLDKFEGMYKVVVIDLRDNTGGLVTDMIECLSIFLEKDVKLELLNLTTMDIENYILQANNKIRYESLIIIIDRTTYSSSEIFYKLLSKQRNVAIWGQSFGKDCIYEKTFQDETRFVLEKKYLVLL